MATDKVTVTLDTSTIAGVRQAAAQAGVSVSAWVDLAARTRLRAEGARALVEFMGSDPDGPELAAAMREAGAARVRPLDRAAGAA
jgi:hypothetical protein